MAHKNLKEYFSAIFNARDHTEMYDQVDALMSTHSKEDPIYLSDCLLSLQRGGQRVMMALEAQSIDERDLFLDDRTLWTIQVLCDEWGNVPKPGETIYKKQMRGLKDRDGKLVPNTLMNIAKIDGSYEERFIKKIPYVVDNKGCIRCGFSDAVHFLHSYGVHGATGLSMTTKPEKLEVGEGKVIHYWRYKEIDKDMYKALPKLTRTKKVVDNEELV